MSTAREEVLSLEAHLPRLTPACSPRWTPKPCPSPGHRGLEGRSEGAGGGQGVAQVGGSSTQCVG